MKKNITKFGLLHLLIGLTIVNFAQTNNNVTNLNVETPLISGGAESSIFIEEQKKLGNKSIFYNQIQSAQAPAGVEGTTAVTPIETIDFDLNGAHNGGSYSIPPDPNGAIGPNHLVNVVNTSIEVFDKNGANISSQSLKSFFTSLSPLTNTFDPKVLYDQYNNRFVVVTLERTTGPNTSHIYLAVSQTSDPTAGWYFHAIDSKTNIGGSDYWADYPGFSVGENGIYITNNMFSFASNTFGGVRLWTIDKGVVGGFYNGALATVTIVDPIVGGTATTLQPAHMFGTSPAGVGTYLVAHSGLSNGVTSFIEVFSVSDALPTPAITFLNYFNLGAIDTYPSLPPTPTAPQLGSGIGIETNDRRAYNAVWRNSNLFVSTIILPSAGPNAGQATAHWIQFNTNSLMLADQGSIGGEDIAPNTHTFFPSIAVNAIGEMIIGFAASASTIYPGAYYTFRFPYDAPGTVQSSKTLRAGDDYYYRQFGGTRNRWGDYSGSSVDPNNDITFCLFNEYAMTRGTELLPNYPGQDGRWGTVFGIMPNLDLTVLLEGPYAGGGAMTTGAAQNAGIPLTQPYNVAPWSYLGQESMAALPPNIADWVLITLRKDLNPALPDPTTAVDVASRAALLKIDGTIVDLNGSAMVGFSVEPGNYYVVVQHRNHLPIMSPTAIAIN